MIGNSSTNEMVWQCPKCGRIFHGYVFEAGASTGGPSCDSCLIPLVWVAVESGRTMINAREWRKSERLEDMEADSLEDEDD